MKSDAGLRLVRSLPWLSIGTVLIAAVVLTRGGDIDASDGYVQFDRCHSDLVKYAWSHLFEPEHQDEPHSATMSHHIDTWLATRLRARRDGNTCVIYHNYDNTSQIDEWAAPPVNASGEYPVSDIYEMTRYDADHGYDYCGGCDYIPPPEDPVCRRVKSPCYSGDPIGTGHSYYVDFFNSMYARAGGGGFNESWVETKIRRNCGEGIDSVLLTGWKMTGAIVEILSFVLFKDEANYLGNKTIQVVTFGAPEALSDASAAEVHQKVKYYRVVLEGDPDPAVDFDGISHTGGKVDLGSGSTFADYQAYVAAL